MRYIKLQARERETLSEGYKNHPKHHFRKRCHALLMSDLDIKVPVISSVLGVRTRTIYEWMNRWESMGLSGLGITPGRGKKPILSIKDEGVVGTIKKS